MTSDTPDHLVCDYLIVGAGATSLAFLDTILTEQPSAQIIMVDKGPIPGGHWVYTYPFCHLHQPSVMYGVASRQLEGNWLKHMLTTFSFPWKHRASQAQVVQHFGDFVRDKVAYGQLQYFPNSEFDFSDTKETTAKADDGEPTKWHSFVERDDKDDGTKNSQKLHKVQVRVKVVNGVVGQCRIPSQEPLAFPVDEGLTVVTPNQLYESFQSPNATKGDSDSTPTKYVILGNGKTAMDTVVYLQRTMKISPDDIVWIIPNDVWTINRDGIGSPWSWPRRLLKNHGDSEKAALSLEATGTFLRLDPDIMPTKFRYAVIDTEESGWLRKTTQRIRRGRVTRIIQSNDDGGPIVEFGPDQEPLILEAPAEKYVFVHCTSPGPFHGKAIDQLFHSEDRMDLHVLFAPPIGISMSILAYLESARVKGTLDVGFGRKLLAAKDRLDGGSDMNNNNGEDVSADEVLRRLIRAWHTLESASFKESDYRSFVNMALFLALGDRDPMVIYRWLQGNRLSFFSIPKYKGRIYEALELVIGEGTDAGYTPGEIELLRVLQEKLEVLKGM